jgi:transcriptional regulator with XRE-family HTH domain
MNYKNNLLLELRKAKSLSLSKLAIELGLSKQLIYKLENGKSVNLKYEYALKYSNYFGVEVTELYNN